MSIAQAGTILKPAKAIYILWIIGVGEIVVAVVVAVVHSRYPSRSPDQPPVGQANLRMVPIKVQIIISQLPTLISIQDHGQSNVIGPIVPYP